MDKKRSFQSAKDVMRKKVFFVDGMATAKEAVDLMRSEKAKALVVKKRHPQDAYGIVVVQDRPIYGDTVFATTAMERGFMTPEEYHLYVDVYRNMSRDVMPPDVFVFLDVSPEECHARMNSRGREQESGVP